MVFTHSTSNAASAWRPDLYEFAPADVVPNALILQCSTQAGSIEGDAPSVKVAFITDDDAQFTPEGNEIPEGQPELSEALIYTSKITKLFRVTREQYSQPNTAVQLAQSASRVVVKKADEAFLTQADPDPAVAPSAGLLNVSGIEDGGTLLYSLDGLIDLVAALEVNGATPTHIVLGPLGWALLRQYKQDTDTSNVSLLGVGATDAQPRLLGLPVIVNKALTGYDGLVIDRSAVVSATGAIDVATSQDAYFTHDSVGYRVTWRIGHTVPRPDRIGKFIVGSGS